MSTEPMTENVLSQAELHALLRRDDAPPAQAASPDGVLDLPEDFGIEHAGALYALLAPHVETPGAVTLGGSRVSRLHTAGLQVLAAFVRTRTAFGRVTRWQDPSPELCSGAARLGLESLLGLAKPARS